MPLTATLATQLRATLTPLASFTLALLLLCLPAASALAQSELPASVARELARAGIPPANVALWVQAVDATEPALSLHADRPMNPASTMKLATAFAALEQLGPAHTWTTRIAVQGPIVDGRLHGDLHLIGGGDPLLSYDRLWRLLQRIRASGIREVGGDIVLDGSALRLPPHDANAFDGRGLRPYNSGPSGLLLHFNTLHLHLQPQAAGQAVLAIAAPPLAGLEIDSRIIATPGACGSWQQALDARLENTTNGARLILGGKLPASCGARDWSLAPFAPDDFATALVAGLWAESGGQLDGRVRKGHTPPEARTLFEADSLPLAEAVREMNKWSSNLIAWQIVATLGAQRLDSLDMIADGSRAIADTLARADIPTQRLLIENGAGLSRVARLRADTLAALLLTAWQRPWMPEFIAALSLAGIDGTARRRLPGSPARGHAHIKTGTLDGVRAIAGYVLDRHGQRHVIVMLVNDPQASASEAAQDALIEWVWSGGK